jgi:hypothetical protein
MAKLDEVRSPVEVVEDFLIQAEAMKRLGLWEIFMHQNRQMFDRIREYINGGT